MIAAVFASAAEFNASLVPQSLQVALNRADRQSQIDGNQIGPHARMLDDILLHRLCCSICCAIHVIAVVYTRRLLCLERMQNGPEHEIDKRFAIRLGGAVLDGRIVLILVVHRPSS